MRTVPAGAARKASQRRRFLTDPRTSMPSPEAASRVVGRLFRADGDHITDLKIPLSTRPVDVVLWYSRVFQYQGTEASGQPVYFEASAYTGGRMMLPYVAWI